MVALTTLRRFLEPRLLPTTSRMPAASRTGRMAPPQMMPVPSGAGLRRTLPPSQTPVTSWGMVVPFMQTGRMALRAASPPLRMASPTSLALPMPRPTLPLLSPTTMTAEKLKRRPPFTVLAQRLTNTVFSSSSGPASRSRLLRSNITLPPSWR